MSTTHLTRLADFEPKKLQKLKIETMNKSVKIYLKVFPSLPHATPKASLISA